MMMTMKRQGGIGETHLFSLPFDTYKPDQLVSLKILNIQYLQLFYKKYTSIDRTTNRDM